jgi:signal transduction histidine kinase
MRGLRRRHVFDEPPDRAGVRAAIVWLFDAISIEFLDRLPNAITVSAIVALIACCQVGIVLVLRFSELIQDALASMAIVVAATVCVTIPIAGFGQMQYRRARQAYFDTIRLAEELTGARDAARNASAEKSRFLASMSHELRTPLNAILGFSEVIKREEFGPIGMRRYVEYAGDIHRSGQHLLSLINDILDLSKIEAGGESVRKEAELNLPCLIRDVCATMQVLAAQNAVHLTYTIADEKILVAADSRMMKQVLLNLISNAIKFTGEGGVIEVKLAKTASGVALSVADTGVGMSAKEQAIALEPFGQIDSFQARKHKGTGLGLTLVKVMVGLHDGRLEIQSTPGEGTVVSVFLPAVQAGPISTRTADAAAAA